MDNKEIKNKDLEKVQGGNINFPFIEHEKIVLDFGVNNNNCFNDYNCSDCEIRGRCPWIQ